MGWSGRLVALNALIGAVRVFLADDTVENREALQEALDHYYEEM